MKPSSNAESPLRGKNDPATPVKPKPRWSKPLEWWATRQLLSLLRIAGMVLPLPALRAAGRGLGNAAYAGMKRYRLVALSNLDLAFGDAWSAEKREVVARQSFRVLGVTLVDFLLRQPRISMDEIEREVAFAGKEHYEEAFARGKGVILITAHYGNWEMMGPRLAREGFQVSAISRTADDPGTERMIESIRTRCGTRQIPRQRAAREGLAALRRNEILAILLDQNTAEGGVFVPFFGRLASTATGPAVFALKTGAALVPTFCIGEADGRHTMVAYPPIYPEPTGDRNADILRLTAQLTQVIEQQIRKRPELWFWLHNRWKLRPTAEQAAATARILAAHPSSNQTPKLTSELASERTS